MLLRLKPWIQLFFLGRNFCNVLFFNVLRESFVWGEISKRFLIIGHKSYKLVVLQVLDFCGSVFSAFQVAGIIIKLNVLLNDSPWAMGLQQLAHRFSTCRHTFSAACVIGRLHQLYDALIACWCVCARSCTRKRTHVCGRICAFEQACARIDFCNAFIAACVLTMLV